MLTYELLKRRVVVERWREKARYKRWVKFSVKRPQDAGVVRERAKWWGLYSDAWTKRVGLERQMAQHAPRFRPGWDVSANAVNFIKRFEGYIGNVYNDGTGVMTVGYGHTENVPGTGVWVPGQKHRYYLTEGEATELLHKDLEKNYAPAVRELGLRTDSQFAGVLSFVYNCGVGAIGSGTQVGRLLKAHQIHAAANALLGWDMAGGKVLPGLLRRREAERAKLLQH